MYGRKGIGDLTAPCPSMEQLQGIVDLNDPCQNAGISTLPVVSPQGAALQAQVYGPLQPQQATLLGVPVSYWAIAGAVVAGLLLFGGSR